MQPRRDSIRQSVAIFGPCRSLADRAHEAPSIPLRGTFSLQCTAQTRPQMESLCRVGLTQTIVPQLGGQSVCAPPTGAGLQERCQCVRFPPPGFSEVSKPHQTPIRKSSGGHQEVIRRSSGGHQEWRRPTTRRSPGGHQEVSRRSSGGHQVVIRRSSDSRGQSGGHQEVIRRSSGGHREVIRCADQRPTFR